MVAPANERANWWSFPTGPVLRTAQSFCDTLGGHLRSWVQTGSNLPVLWESISGVNGAESTVRVKVNSRMLYKGAGRIKNRSLHAQESSARCEITDRFQPGQGRSRSHRTSARRKGPDRRHRRQERDRYLQSAGHCVHDGCGHSDSKPGKRIA